MGGWLMVFMAPAVLPSAGMAIGYPINNTIGILVLSIMS